MQFRIGNGYDVHRFGEPAVATALTIGGVSIPYERPLLAVHALCDAVLGALALGDIGHHFPDSDTRYRGISSLQLLQHVMALAAERGWSLANVDMTLVAQAPRFAPHIQSMRETLAPVLEVDIGQVSVKATTTEGLGFAGRKEGVACYAVALLQRESAA